jgi:carbonic anhydrase/acetyltransferase-like protein (isoleucine patch superfamily)
VVLTGTVVEPGSLYAGTPARKVKDVSPEQTRDMIERIAGNYIMYAGWFRENGAETAPADNDGQ